MDRALINQPVGQFSSDPVCESNSGIAEFEQFIENLFHSAIIDVYNSVGRLVEFDGGFNHLTQHDMRVIIPRICSICSGCGHHAEDSAVSLDGGSIAVCGTLTLIKDYFREGNDKDVLAMVTKFLNKHMQDFSYRLRRQSTMVFSSPFTGKAVLVRCDHSYNHETWGLLKDLNKEKQLGSDDYKADMQMIFDSIKELVMIICPFCGGFGHLKTECSSMIYFRSLMASRSQQHVLDECVRKYELIQNSIIHPST